MYKPPEASSLELATKTIRLGIQGHGGTGKSTSLLTFPNCIVGDVDNSVDVENARAVKVNPSTILKLKFYDQEFRDKIQRGISVRDGVEKWINESLSKLSPEQTFGLDSWTFLQDSFDKQTDSEVPNTQRGARDEFWFWARKQEYARDVLVEMQKAKCNIVVIFHEVKEIDDKGRETGKVTPMMQGKFAYKLMNYFPFYFRQIAFEKIFDAKKQEEEAGKMGITTEQFRKAQEFSTNKTVYFWQTVTTAICNCKSKIPFARFIPATYEVFRNPEPWLQK